MPEAIPAPLTVRTLAPATRLSLRTREAERAGAALGVPLPRRIGESARAGTRLALMLGPDEWMILAADEERDPLLSASIDAPHSLADISDRELTIEIAGRDAAEALAAGIPRDLSRIRSGTGARTVFDGVSVILLRTAPDRFELHVWRSFAPHVQSILEAVRHELAIGL